MSVFDFAPGEWYLLITCRFCDMKQPLLHDLTKGRSLIKATYSFTCPYCGEKADYDSTQIERYQHMQDGD